MGLEPTKVFLAVPLQHGFFSAIARPRRAGGATRHAPRQPRSLFPATLATPTVHAPGAPRAQARRASPPLSVGLGQRLRLPFPFRRGFPAMAAPTGGAAGQRSLGASNLPSPAPPDLQHCTAPHWHQPLSSPPIDSCDAATRRTATSPARPRRPGRNYRDNMGTLVPICCAAAMWRRQLLLARLSGSGRSPGNWVLRPHVPR